MNTTQLSLDGIGVLKLLDESGGEVAISALWRDRRAVLVFHPPFRLTDRSPAGGRTGTAGG